MQSGPGTNLSLSKSWVLRPRHLERFQEGSKSPASAGQTQNGRSFLPLLSLVGHSEFRNTEIPVTADQGARSAAFSSAASASGKALRSLVSSMLPNHLRAPCCARQTSNESTKPTANKSTKHRGANVSGCCEDRRERFARCSVSCEVPTGYWSAWSPFWATDLLTHSGSSFWISGRSSSASGDSCRSDSLGGDLTNAQGFSWAFAVRKCRKVSKPPGNIAGSSQ